MCVHTEQFLLSLCLILVFQCMKRDFHIVFFFLAHGRFKVLTPGFRRLDAFVHYIVYTLLGMSIIVHMCHIFGQWEWPWNIIMSNIILLLLTDQIA